MRRVLSALSLMLVIALATAAMSWNRARVAPLPEPSGEREVSLRRGADGDFYVPAGHDRLPTLVFSTGLGVKVAAYRTFLTELASHGFLVVAVDYPAVTVEDNSQFIPALPKISASVTAALDRLTTGTDSLATRVDTTRVAAIGHSFGGGAA